MRKLLTGFLILLTAAVCHASPVQFKGPGDAWPWGAEMPFPWKGIQGTWVTTIGNKPVYFSFTAIPSDRGTNQLRVIAYEGPNCVPLAEGGGFEKNRVVKGAITGAYGSFRMMVHVFRVADLKDSKKAGSVRVADGTKTVTVMNLKPLSDDMAVWSTFQLTKMNSDFTGLCEKY